jgi:glutamate/tyrosine decarboxylase-like PLP-dependent enzyme
MTNQKHDNTPALLSPELLSKVQRHAAEWFCALGSRKVRASLTTDQLRDQLGGPLPDNGTNPEALTNMLAAAGMQGTVATAGPRYFGFVIGGSLPAALAADWLVSAWDQNSAVYVMSPLVSVIEQITGAWLRELAGLPPSMSFGFVTGCQMANFTSLAAARHRVLANAGWDVEANGLFGAPPIQVVVSEESHYTIAMALRLLGLGANRVDKIPADSQGRMRSDALATVLRTHQGPCIVCAQAGNVNTGAVDPLTEIGALAKERGAWLHVDGAFGLWAAASPAHTHLVRGIERADSIATDAHKWLNVPYDCGIVFCADEPAHRSAMSLAAAYIVATGTERDPHEFVPEESRRARAVPVYAAIRWPRRNGRAPLPPGPPLRRRPPRRGPSSPQRSRPQSSPRLLRHARPNQAHHRRHSARRNLLVRRHSLAKSIRHAHQRQQLVHHRRRRRPKHRSHSPRRATVHVIEPLKVSHRTWSDASVWFRTATTLSS